MSATADFGDRGAEEGFGNKPICRALPDDYAVPCCPAFGWDGLSRECHMTSMKKTLALVCAASILSMGVAFAQDQPAAPAPGGTTAAPAAGDATAGADAMATPKKHMSKKHMSKKHKKKSKKAM